MRGCTWIRRFFARWPTKRSLASSLSTRQRGGWERALTSAQAARPDPSLYCPVRRRQLFKKLCPYPPYPENAAHRRIGDYNEAQLEANQVFLSDLPGIRQ